MLRIAVSVEGATEREFVTQVLAPYFAQQQKFLQAIDMRGNVSLDKIKHELQTLLHSFDYITTLYDFYGFKKRENRSIEQLEQAILDCVATERQACFIPYVQQYEFEALLFAAPKVMAEYFFEPDKYTQIERIVRDCGGPEGINDGFDTCPNRRIKGLFGAFDKKLDGPEICKEIGLAQIRANCPRFDAWLGKLEAIVVP
jgi:hypothetical protein